MNAPRVSRRKDILQLSYDTRDRVHCSTTYPLTAPNGSEVAIYAHDHGVQVLWRGGRRRRERDGGRASPRANGNHADVIVIDDEDDEAPPQQQDAEDDVEYEDADEESDEVTSYPDIIQDLNIEHESKVLHIAVPLVNPALVHQLSNFARSRIILAYADLTGTVGTILLPLRPPSEAEKASDSIQLQHQIVARAGAIPRDLAIRLSSNRSENSLRLKVATCGTSLKVWELSGDTSDFQTQLCLDHPTPIRTITFPSSRAQEQLLVSDFSGNLRVYEFPNLQDEDDDMDEDKRSKSGLSREGWWATSFSAPFLDTAGSPSMARRKNILGASWVLGGRGILVLLEDGAWGVWILDSSQTANKTLHEFSLKGHLGEGPSTVSGDDSEKTKLGSRLAPMTPNTRKAKSEKLFQKPQRTPGAAPTGGIKVTPVTNKDTGGTDESVIMWYDNNIYTIPSMQICWKQSNASNPTGTFNSLHTPRINARTDINLMNEQITSVSVFNNLEQSGSQWTSKNVRRNLLISAEHRLIMVHHLLPPSARFNLKYEEKERKQDQIMLDAGELDVGGMDRMLDSMAGPPRNSDRARHVGFAR